MPLRYYPGLFLVASAKAAYAENKVNYSNYRTTTEELQDWISGNNNSNNKTTTTTGEVRSNIVYEVERMYSFIKSCKDEKNITYDNYLKNPVVAVVAVVSQEQLVISSTTGEKVAVV